MKHNRNTVKRHPAHCRSAYPNAADPTYFTNKALEILTAIASGIGFITAMMFLVIIA